MTDFFIRRFSNFKYKQLFCSALLAVFCVFFIFPSQSFANTLASWPIAPNITGSSAILMDADSGAVLYSNNATQKLYPASITKILTCILSLERLNQNDTITYTDAILNAIPADAAKLGLKPSETVTVRDTLYALMLRSAADSAVALACQVSGSESAFAQEMTAWAKNVGAVNTNFTNATGLHDDNHYTTAYDMAKITQAALKNPEFCNIWKHENYTLSATNLTEGYRIWNRHYLLLTRSEYYYKYAIGGKTGYTDQAGRTLVTVAEKDGLKLISIIMNSDNEHIFTDTIALFEYGFQNFSKISIKDNESRFGSGYDSIPVIDKLYGNNASIFSLSNDFMLIPKNVSISDIPYKLEFLTTPQNSKIASITYEYNGNYLGKTSLLMNLANQPSNSVGPAKFNQEQNTTSIKETTSINIYLLAGSIIGGLILFLILIKYIHYYKTVVTRRNKRLYK